MKELSGTNIDDALGTAFTQVNLKKQSILQAPLILAV
jgi:hypothetical protein